MDRLQGDKNRKQDADADRNETEYASQFISRLWNDLGYNIPKTENPKSNGAPQDTKQPDNSRKDSPDKDSKRSDLPNTPPLLPLPQIPPQIPEKAPAADLRKRLPEYKLPEFEFPNEGSQSASGVDGGPGRVYEMRHLNYRAADHRTPDAMVRVPNNLDPNKPIHLVIYNHGWATTAERAYSEEGLDEQMAKAPPNSVLIVPEWQKVAGASSGNQGNFSQSGVFKGMVQEIFNKTPGLTGKTLNDVDNITIISHSAGYNATESELYNNGLSGKVTNLVLLDSLYDNTGFDKWIGENIRDLAAGKKHFYNIFSDTSDYSKAQAIRVTGMLQQAGLSTKSMLQDFRDDKKVLDAETLASHPIVFKFSSAKGEGREAHAYMPKVYVAPIEAALNRPKKTGFR